MTFGSKRPFGEEDGPSAQDIMRLLGDLIANEPERVEIREVGGIGSFWQPCVRGGSKICLTHDDAWYDLDASECTFMLVMNGSAIFAHEPGHHSAVHLLQAITLYLHQFVRHEEEE